jgi:hypothetical protein
MFALFIKASKDRVLFRDYKMVFLSVLRLSGIVLWVVGGNRYIWVLSNKTEKFDNAKAKS